MKKFINLIIVTALCISCSQSNKKIEAQTDLIILDEKVLINYTMAISMIESEQRGLLTRLNSGEALNNSEKETLNSVVKKNGFESLEKFESINRKISIIYSSIQVLKDNGKVKTEKMKKHSINNVEYELVQKYLQELAEALQDVKIPVDSIGK